MILKQVQVFLKNPETGEPDLSQPRTAGLLTADKDLYFAVAVKGFRNWDDAYPKTRYTYLPIAPVVSPSDLQEVDLLVGFVDETYSLTQLFSDFEAVATYLRQQYDNVGSPYVYLANDNAVLLCLHLAKPSERAQNYWRAVALAALVMYRKEYVKV